MKEQFWLLGIKRLQSGGLTGLSDLLFAVALPSKLHIWLPLLISPFYELLRQFYLRFRQARLTVERDLGFSGVIERSSLAYSLA